MTVRRIVTSEDPLLREKSKKVRRFGEPLERLVSDMFESMYAANGLGLAAPQIGVLQRVFVIEMPATHDDDGNETRPAEQYVLVNPEIVRKQGEEKVEEACLSVPGYQGLVKRATHVVIKGRDETGKPVRYMGDGLLAQAFQHESDHLDGVLYIDRVENPNDVWEVEAEEDDEKESSAI